MSRYHRGTTAAVLALMAAIGSSAMAQDQAPGTPAVPGTPPQQSQALPSLLDQLNLTDIETRDGRRGRRIEGDLPEGGRIEAMIDGQGNVMMVESQDAAMPQAVIDTLVPQGVRDNAILGQFAAIERIGTRDGRVMVGGEDAEGTELRAGFDAEGRLMRFGRDDEDGPAFREGRNRDGRDGRGDWHQGGRSGMMGDHARPGRDRLHGEHRRGDGSSGGRGGMPQEGRFDGPRGMMAPDDQAGLGKVLGAAGYSDLGNARPAGPRFVIEAVNPAGEPVTLEIDAQGDVVRETAR